MRRLLLILLVSSIAATPTLADVIYVDASAGGGNTGASWLDAFTDLQLALAVATGGDEIWVAAGTYKPTAGTDRSATFQMMSGVAIYGGFAGGETMLSQRNIVSNLTILSGEIGTSTDNDNCYNVVTAGAVDATAILDGVTVTRGFAEVIPFAGGGLIAVGGSPTVTNVTFADNFAFQYGGGAYHESSFSVYTGCTFTGNTAGGTIGPVGRTGFGGGLYATGGQLTVNECAFAGNTVDPPVFSGAGATGAGAHFHQENSTVSGCTFDGNNASGVKLYESDAIFSACTFSDNDYSGLVGNNCQFEVNDCSFEDNGDSAIRIALGGGMCVRRSTFSGNSAPDGGAMMLSPDGLVLIEDCLFIENTAADEGGAIRVAGLPFIATNCVFIGNSADEGGAIWAGLSNDATFTNVTFRDNSANTGGAIFCRSSLTFYNAILWGNTALSDPQIKNSDAASTFFSHSLIEGCGGSGGGWAGFIGTDGGGNVDADPRFFEPAVKDLRLRYDSPAFDGGDGAAPNLPANDANGLPRVSSAAPDMGAFELQCAAGTVVYVDADATGAETGNTWADAHTSLQYALATACAGVTEIWVAGGTYAPTVSGTRSYSFELRNGLALYGGFAGTEVSLGDRDIGANPTILSGAVGAPMASDNVYHVITGSGTDATAVLDGFIVTDGFADGAAPDNRGGGMLNDAGGPTVRNVVFHDNFASEGGAITNWIGSHATFTNVLFHDNNALTGGAMYNLLSDPMITNAAFTKNNASSGGSAIYNNLADPTVVNTIVWGNAGVQMTNLGGSAPAVSFSLLEGSGGSGGGWDPTYGTDGGSNIDADPAFANPAADDYRLSAASPAVDAGDDTAPNLAAIDLDGNPRVSGSDVDMGPYEYEVASGVGDVPVSVGIRAVYPNPFNPRVTIAFEQASRGTARVTVYDVRGARVATLYDGEKPAGAHRLTWSGTDDAGNRVASGVYIVTVEVPGATNQRKITLLK